METEFKKSDLKTGMRVKTRNGKTFIVSLSLLGEPYCITESDGYHIPLVDFSEDLKNNGIGGPDFNITHIFDIPRRNNECFNYSIKGSLLWERKEQIPEYTMEEIIKLVGHDLKIKK